MVIIMVKYVFSAPTLLLSLLLAFDPSTEPRKSSAYTSD